MLSPPGQGRQLVFAAHARDRGALTAGRVPRPCHYEGKANVASACSVCMTKGRKISLGNLVRAERYSAVDDRWSDPTLARLRLSLAACVLPQ